MGNVILLGGLSLLHGFTQDVYQKCRQALTFSKYDYISHASESLAFYREEVLNEEPAMYVPRYFHSEFRQTPYTIYDDRCDGLPLPEIVCKKELIWGGIDQKTFVTETANRTIKNGFGGYAIAPCGAGKTLMGEKIIQEIGRTALIITPRIFITKQWIDEGAASFTVDGKPLKIGRFQGRFKDTGNQFPIVAGVANSVINAGSEFFKTFGTIIFDECQHLPASMWMTILSLAKCKYMIGMTAGLTRSDGLEGVFKYLIGNEISRIDKVTLQKGEVQQIFIQSGVRLPSDTMNSITDRVLSSHEARNRLVVRAIVLLYNQNRQSMVFSSRLDHIDTLFDLLVSVGIPEGEIGKFIGDTSEKEQKYAVSKKITLSTYAMGKEALNCPWKDSLVTATPPSSKGLRQLYGRIARLDPGMKKPVPLVIDFVDVGTFLFRKAEVRKRLWEQEGLTVSRYKFY